MLLLIIQSSQENYFLIGYLDEFTRSLVLILPKVCGYFKRINVKGGDKDRNSKLISFHIEDSKLLERKKNNLELEWRLKKNWFECLWWCLHKR